MTPSDESVIAAASRGFWLATWDGIQAALMPGIRWLKGYRKGEEVVHGILWKYEYRRGSLTKLEPFRRNCDALMKQIWGNLSGDNCTLCRLCGCRKCGYICRTMDKPSLTEHAREVIQAKLCESRG